MQESMSPITKLSYTGKDFVAIYTEMLDLVKALTSRWDPSISNESDPGVILVKLNAIIADKINFNTDTALLETFPISVTQAVNARKLFEQLGYYMHWYKSATCDVSLQWTDAAAYDSDEASIYYTIPPFTTVSDETSSTIYTLIGTSEGLLDDEFRVGGQRLYRNGQTITFKAIQGIPINYSINGTTTITYDMLDSNNRLYFPYSDIAENGVFICNQGLNNYSTWIRKDNLALEEVNGNNHFYRFGVSQDNMSCYIEFPVNIEELMLSGLNITYIRTSGELGNINANLIVQFYNSVTPLEDTTVTITSTNVTVNNINNGEGGKDPEDIDTAYRNYKSTVGTFKTLVTLRDYLAYVLQSNLVSNGFVCDRTNDVQCTVPIMTTSNGTSTLVNMVESDEVVKEFSMSHPIKVLTGSTFTTDDDVVTPITSPQTFTSGKYMEEEPVLDAFSLKLYFLKYAKSPQTKSGYETTFDMISAGELESVKAYINDSKLISHDIKDIKTIGGLYPGACMFKNKYPLNVRIIPQYVLTKAEKQEVKDNMFKAIYQALNSREIEFGERVDTDYVLERLKACDTRIKSVMLDKITYETFAVYFDGVNYKEINITDVTSASDFFQITYENIPDSGGPSDDWDNPSYGYVRDRLQFIVQNPQSLLEKMVTNPLATWRFRTNATERDPSVSTSNADRYLWWFKDTLYPDGTDYQVPSLSVNMGISGQVVNPTLFHAGDSVAITLSPKVQLRLDTYARSVLAGKTQFLIPDEKFDYQLSQMKSDEITGVKSLIGNTSITLDKVHNTYTMRDNESLAFTSPNLLDSVKYSNYTRFEYNLLHEVPVNSDYRLSTGEYIVFYWKESSDANSIYKYCGYGEGSIIKPMGFSLSPNSETFVTGQTIKRLIDQSPIPKVASYEKYGDLTNTLSANVQSGLASSGNILSGAKKHYST